MAMATALAIGVPLGVVAGVVGLWVVVGLATGRAVVEHAPYTRVWKRGGFELRRYDPSIVARVRINRPDLREASSLGFGVIAGYIFGKNAKVGGEKQSIAMTTPVVALPVHSAARPQPLVSPELAAAAPVVASTPLLGGDAVDVMFVMPRQFSSVDALPTPLDFRVQVEAVPERWEAVETWYGSYATQAGFEGRVSRLLAALRAEGLEPLPPVSTLGGGDAVMTAKSYSYDPPWTPWFVKRNEVAIVVRPPPASAAP